MLNCRKGLQLGALLRVCSRKRRERLEGSSGRGEGKRKKGMIHSTRGCPESGQAEEQELLGPLKTPCPIIPPVVWSVRLLGPRKEGLCGYRGIPQAILIPQRFSLGLLSSTCVHCQCQVEHDTNWSSRARKMCFQLHSSPQTALE